MFLFLLAKELKISHRCAVILSVFNVFKLTHNARLSDKAIFNNPISLRAEQSPITSFAGAWTTVIVTLRTTDAYISNQGQLAKSFMLRPFLARNVVELIDCNAASEYSSAFIEVCDEHAT